MISDAQRAALATLAPLLPCDAYLAGGVAVAAHLHHRTSRDLDVFSTSDPTRLLPELERTPGVIVMSTAAGTVELEVDGVPTSLLQYRYPPLVPAASVGGLPVPVASLDDLACMKLSAIAQRGAARDFWDLHEIVTTTGRTLDDLLDVFRRKHPTVDLGHVLRALVYFGEATPLATGLSQARWGTIRSDLERWVRSLLVP